VKVGFESRELKLLCCSQAALDRRFGSDVAALIRCRLSEAAGVPTLADLMALPAVSFALGHDKGRVTIAIELSNGASLVLHPVGQEGKEFDPDVIIRVAVARIARS